MNKGLREHLAKAEWSRSDARAKSGTEPQVAGVRISSADRVVFPDAGFSKLDLVEYYKAMADRLLPFIEGRPLSTVRCPKGRAKKCFFQKHLGETLSDPVKSIEVEEKGGAASYIAVDSLEGLITLIQFGVIEIHPWGSRGGDLERPEALTFDLDPGEDVSWAALCGAARRVRDVLEEVGLESYLKTSGGKGLHVVAPLRPHAEWDDAKAFCRGVSKVLEAESPERYVANMSKSKRKGRIFVDYLRNSRGATSVAAYSARARPGAPVSTPLRWGELGRVGSSDRYTVKNIRRRLGGLGEDPWAGFFKTRQRLTSKRIEAVATL